MYIHIPFCRSRCYYCSFLSHSLARRTTVTPSAYCAALLEEIRSRGAWARSRYVAAGRLVDTVFFGGGTPTALSADELTALIGAAKEHFPVAEHFECTVEANPETLTPRYIGALAEAGVNRLSVGIQATQARHLHFMGRSHRWETVEALLRLLPGGPIPSLSFDLMCGIPGLTFAELKQSLQRVLMLKPSHISLYELTAERGTRYARWSVAFPRQRPLQERTVAQQRLVTRLLSDHGFYRYEVSNYALPGAECLHNLRYWRGGDYVGMGLGAASRFDQAIVSNPREFNDYLHFVDDLRNGEDPCAALVKAQRCARDHGSSMAPPADRFLRLRTRAGVLPGEIALKSTWLKRGLLRHSCGRLEMSSGGLDYAELVAREAG